MEQPKQTCLRKAEVFEGVWWESHCHSQFPLKRGSGARMCQVTAHGNLAVSQGFLSVQGTEGSNTGKGTIGRFRKAEEIFSTSLSGETCCRMLKSCLGLERCLKKRMEKKFPSRALKHNDSTSSSFCSVNSACCWH